jgi:hypothetical protein
MPRRATVLTWLSSRREQANESAPDLLHFCRDKMLHRFPIPDIHRIAIDYSQESFIDSLQKDKFSPAMFKHQSMSASAKSK